MSVSTMSWAFKLDLRPSSLKFLLVAIADNADELGFAYPSLAALAEKTSQDRKTVIAGIAELERIGFLADTGQRVGKTKQVKVYRLVGMDSGERHYVYRVTHEETGRYYIGVRTCYGAPEADASYMGSGTWPLAALRGRLQLTKSVISVHRDRRSAELAESVAIIPALEDPLCQNRRAEPLARVPNSPKIGLLPLPDNRTENGTLSAANSTVFPAEQYRFSAERVPKTVHGTIMEPSGNRESGARAARGTRLPDDFELTEERRQVALAERLDPDRTFANFRDHWRAESGQRARKCDWDATWRKWCRTDSNRPRGPVAPPAAPPTSDQVMASAKAFAINQACPLLPNDGETAAQFEARVKQWIYDHPPQRFGKPRITAASTAAPMAEEVAP